MKNWQKVISAVTVLSMCASYVPVIAQAHSVPSVEGGDVAVSIDQITLTPEQAEALDYQIPVLVKLDKNPGINVMEFGITTSPEVYTEVITKSAEAIWAYSGFASLFGRDIMDDMLAFEMTASARGLQNWMAWATDEVVSDTGNLALVVVKLPYDFSGSEVRLSGGEVRDGYRYYDIAYAEMTEFTNDLYKANSVDYSDSVEYTDGWIRIAEDGAEEPIETTEEPAETTENQPVESNSDIVWNNINPDLSRDGKIDAKDAALVLVYAAEFGAGNVKDFSEFMEKQYPNG